MQHIHHTANMNKFTKTFLLSLFTVYVLSFVFSQYTAWKDHNLNVLAQITICARDLSNVTQTSCINKAKSYLIFDTKNNPLN